MEEKMHLLKTRYSKIPCLKLAMDGDLEKFEVLCRLGPGAVDNVNYVYKNSGDSTLMIAARHGHSDLVAYLIGCGADIEHRNKDGKRPLHEASFSGCLGCVMGLLNSGAEIDPLKHGDWTPLMIACTRGYLDIAKLLIENGALPSRVNKDGWNCFHLAVRGNHVSLAKFLHSVDSKLWLNVSKNGRTPLHTASMHGCMETVRFMIHSLGYGADEVDACGSSPMMDALRFGYPDIAHILRESRKASLNHTDRLGRNSLHIAAQSGQLGSVIYLLDQCALDVNSRCSESLLSPVHMAAKEGHVDVIACLVDHKADINCMDKNKRTPLHFAAAANRIDSIKYILNRCKQVDLSIRDNLGKLAYELCQSENCRSAFIQLN